MQKFFLSWLLTILVNTAVSAQFNLKQDVVAVAGGENSYNNIVLEWTLGESFIGAAAAPYRLYTIGFHQPIILRQTFSSYKETETAGMQIWPNPVVNSLQVRLNTDRPGNIQLILTDLNGKALFQKQVNGKTAAAEIPFNNIQPGIYLLRIADVNGNNINAYKIIKLN